jgi:cytoskeletal protein RodZ
MNGMSTVAEQLRAAREAKSLTVEQVAESTKIRTDHIRALEEGNFNVFSAPIYIRGSVKLYANALKLDPVALLATLDAELGRTEKYSEPPPLSDQKPTFLDHATLVLAKMNWKAGFAGLAIVALAVILGVSVWAWKHHQKGDSLKNLPPAVYQPANSGDTLPLPKR